MSTPYTRPVSPAERLWLAADELLPPFVIDLVFEGHGELDPDLWSAALARAAEALPGARVQLKGWLCRSRWVDSGRAPGVRMSDPALWDGRARGGQARFPDPLPAEGGPTVELLLAPGDPARIIVRAHHAVMDGVGIMMFAQELFRAARGEDPRPMVATATDLEAARTQQPAPAAFPADEHIAATGRHDGSAHGAVWGRRVLRGRWKRFLPRMASVVARHARDLASDAEAPVCIQVPVDLRRYLDGAGGIGNLTGIIPLVVPPGADTDTVHSQLKQHLESHTAARWVQAIGGMVHVPLWLMRWAGERGADRTNTDGTYGASAILSNVGTFHPELYAAPGFSPTSAFFIPPGGRATAAFLTFSRWGDETSIIATMPVGLASGGRMDALLDAMVEDLEQTGR